MEDQYDRLASYSCRGTVQATVVGGLFAAGVFGVLYGGNTLPELSSLDLNVTAQSVLTGGLVALIGAKLFVTGLRHRLDARAAREIVDLLETRKDMVDDLRRRTGA